MELDPNIAILAALTCGIGYLMVFAGLHKSALELRRRDRSCPSCGPAHRGPRLQRLHRRLAGRRTRS